MTAALNADYRDLAHEVFSLLQSIDPSRLRDELRESIRQRCEQLAARVREATATDDQVGVPLGKVAAVLEETPHAPGDWEVFRKRLHVAYDELVVVLRREAIELPTLRPTNYTRSFFHVFSAVGAALLVQHVLTPKMAAIVSGSFAAAGWTMEISRRHSKAANRVMMHVFKHVAHEHERHRVNSSTWYTTALFLIALTMSPMAVTSALLVLGVGDPAAGLIGRRFGKHKLANGKSLEGALAFVAAGALVTGGALALYYPTLSLASLAVLALASATAGALAELFITRIDDNFSIPVAAGAGCSLAAMALSLA